MNGDKLLYLAICIFFIFVVLWLFRTIINELRTGEARTKHETYRCHKEPLAYWVAIIVQILVLGFVIYLTVGFVGDYLAM